MYLEELSLTHWRSFEQVRVELAEGLNFFVGDNAQGKTNLLEAVYFLAHLASFRTRRSQDLVRSGAEKLSVQGRVRAAGHSRALRVDLSGGRRRLFLDGLPTTELDSFLGSLAVLLFSPGQVELLRGSPTTRRRFLDRDVMRRNPVHAVVLREYQRVLRTRNRCLKEGDWRLAELYAPKIVDLGSRIVAARLEHLARLGERVPGLYRLSVASDETVVLRYRAGWLHGNEFFLAQGSPEDLNRVVAEQLTEALVLTARRERDRRHQIVGPQADDLEVELDGLSAPRHASQGQMRSLLAALVFAEQKILAEEGRRAVLLIDDLSSELDAGRRQALISYLASLHGQVLVTGTDLDSLSGLGPGRVFRVRAGRVMQESGSQTGHPRTDAEPRARRDEPMQTA